MNLNRTDVFIIATLFFQFQLLFELFKTIGFGVLTALGQDFSLVPAITTIVFASGVVFSLQGVRVAVNAYFTDVDAERERGAKAASMGLILTAFSLVTLLVLTRTFAYS